MLLRAFDSLEHMNEQEGAFTGSDEWRIEHRPGIMGLIETYHTVVLETTAVGVEALRRPVASSR